MSLYPSLEDMKVDQILQSEQQQKKQQPKANQGPLMYPGSNPSQLHYDQQQPIFSTASVPAANVPSLSALYPTMNDYMGIDLSSTELQIIQSQQNQLQNMISAQQHKNEIASYGAHKSLIAPITGNSVGLKRALVTNGIREVVLCKGADDKIGMRCKAINNGIFIILVTSNSPAALAGLRFGDQILQVLFYLNNLNNLKIYY